MFACKPARHSYQANRQDLSRAMPTFGPTIPAPTKVHTTLGLAAVKVSK